MSIRTLEEYEHIRSACDLQSPQRGTTPGQATAIPTPTPLGYAGLRRLPLRLHGCTMKQCSANSLRMTDINYMELLCFMFTFFVNEITP